MGRIEVFSRIVRSRSRDNGVAFNLVYQAGLFGHAVGILRQELDSMVRVIYLGYGCDDARRDELLSRIDAGEPWRLENSHGRVTDKSMVELAGQLHGWVGAVYKFGCSFIHLSHLHDYSERDPMELISAEDKAIIVGHLRYYHNGPSVKDPRLEDLLPYLPMVFDKISRNLESEIRDLQALAGAT